MPLSRISTLVLLALAATGCAAGMDAPATDTPVAAAPSADEVAAPADPNGATGNVTVDVTVNQIEPGGHHWGHHHCHRQGCQGSSCPWHHTQGGDGAPPPPPAPSPPAQSSPPNPT